MKNIMIISPYLPWPLRSGGNTGVFYMLEYVGKYENVFFVTLYNRRYNNYKYLQELSVKLPYVHFLMYDYRQTVYKKYEYVSKIFRRVGNTIKFGESSCSMDSLNTLGEITPGFISYINKIIADNNINIVQIEFLGFHPLVFALPENVKKIFIHHELGWVRNELTYGTDIYSSFYKEIKKCQEINILNRFDVVAALTDVDKKKLQEAGVNTNLAVSTLAISNQTLGIRHYRFHNHLTFVGGSGHFPNFDGIRWFVSEVLPLVTSKKKDIVFDVIGNWSDDAKREISSIADNVNFLGFVEDLGVCLKDSIMVVPIRIGSGMRMKILETANYSIPFVSTIVGAEGLVFKNGHDCFITDSASEMADKILCLADDSNMYDQFCKNVHEIFQRNYSIDSLGKKRLDLYEL